ncbi:MAG: hypothetical protein ACYC6V_03005 [Bacillota bacterium]
MSHDDAAGVPFRAGLTRHDGPPFRDPPVDGELIRRPRKLR